MDFENLNNIKDLQVIEAESPEKLNEILISIPLPTKIVSLYGYRQGQRTIHVAYVLTSAKIEKIKEKLNG